MRTLTFILIFTLTVCFATDVDNTIDSLGLSKSDLKEVWFAGRCDEDWSITVNKEIVKNKDMLAYKAITSEFFIKENSQNNEVKLSAGEKCKALNMYYFDDKKSDAIINFIDQDTQFIAKYGYSVLDAIYIEDTQFFSWNGKISKYHKVHAKTLARKGLFSIEEKSSTFNGKPSISLSGKRTPLGDELYTKVFK